MEKNRSAPLRHDRSILPWSRFFGLLRYLPFVEPVDQIWRGGFHSNRLLYGSNLAYWTVVDRSSVRAARIFVCRDEPDSKTSPSREDRISHLVVRLDYGRDRLPDDITLLFVALRSGLLSPCALCAVRSRPQLAISRLMALNLCLLPSVLATFAS